MPRLTSEPVSRVHVLLFERDLTIQQQRYGAKPGVGPAVRMIVRKFLKSLESRQAPSPTPMTEAEEEALFNEPVT